MSAAATKLHHLKLFFSNQYCRAQIVRSTDGHIVADACSWEPALKATLQSTSNKVQCRSTEIHSDMNPMVRFQQSTASCRMACIIPGALEWLPPWQENATNACVCLSY